MGDFTSDISRALDEHGCKVEPCGSRVTCSPPPENTDCDFLVEVTKRDQRSVAQLVNDLHRLNFVWEGSRHYQDAMGNFMSWRRDDVNLILTSNPDFAARHRVATALCKRLNLLDKHDRIALFQAVLYGNQWDGSGTTSCRPTNGTAPDGWGDELQ